ncbi:MAG TPA: flagellar assembly peptidoglycan hydrolase FlgJ, partial [Steroidobacteraceae bacterium]|nr:flagellar assembly peptidoglycan hydrolase FlgJ [Steroidobacteraceae bacterium]
QLCKGKGLGLADLLVKQLQTQGIAQSSDAAKTADPKNILQPSAISAVRADTEQSPTIESVDSVSTAAAGGGRTDAQGVAPPVAISSPDETHDTSAPSPRQTLANTPDEFIAQLWPHAQAAGRELGVDPRTLIAHAALETGWGKYVPCNPDGTCSFNLFGIKASSRWHGAAVGVDTIEYQDGVAVRQRASFRAYDSPADSFRDYASLIKSSPRYAAAVGSGSDATAFASALQQGGYATDPNYATKLAAIADRLNVTLKTDASRPLAFGGRVSIASGGET